MPAQQESPALTVARAHVEAWSRKDWDKARSMLAPDVRVIAMTTAPYPPPADGGRPVRCWGACPLCPPLPDRGRQDQDRAGHLLRRSGVKLAGQGSTHPDPPAPPAPRQRRAP